MEHEHPSFFELDQLAFAPEQERQARLKDCARCQQYIAGQQRELPVPDWARAVAMPASNRPRWRWLSVAVAGAFVGSLAFAVVTRSSGPSGIREKGPPTVSVYVKHGAEVRRWDGTGPVIAGDALMLEIDPAGYRFVSVESLSGLSPEPLYVGELKGTGRVLVPHSFRVDESPGPERLRVRLSRDSAHWTTEINLPKGATR
jgi:hypothetical protein